MGLPNPLSLPEAVAFDAWAVDASGLVLSLFWDCAFGKVKVYVADESDAVHLIVTDTPDPLPEGVHQGWGLMGHHEAFVELARPLGDRAVVDATSGVARPRVSSGAGFERRRDDQYPIDGKKQRRQQRRTLQLARTWQYDEPHRIVATPAPDVSSWHESKSVTVSALNGDAGS